MKKYLYGLVSVLAISQMAGCISTDDMRWLFDADSKRPQATAVKEAKPAIKHIPIYSAANYFPLSTYNQIVNTSSVNIKAYSSQLLSGIEVVGDKSKVKFLNIEVKNNVLYLSDQGSQEAAANGLNTYVKLFTPNLVQINHSGSGRLVVEQLSPHSFSAESHGSGEMKVSGYHIPLSNLKATHSGRIYMSDIKSKNLKVCASGHYKLFLTGQVGVLTAEADGHGRLDASQLAANNVLVKASGNSQVVLNVRSKLSAVAHDNSRIYYYNNPKLNATFMDGTASIINMDN